jgi:hypothetical protein
MMRTASRARVRGDWSANCKAGPYQWNARDYAALRKAAADIGTTPEDLLLVIALETGDTMNPHIAFCNASGYPDAVGLNQITKVAAEGMKLTEAQRLSLLDMTPEEQLPYVTKFFVMANGGKPFSKPPNAVKLYQTNIAPATVGGDVVYTQKTFPCHAPGSGGDPYCNNAGLDYNKDGTITVEDLAFVLGGVSKRPGYQKALAELASSPPSSASTAAGSVMNFAIGLALGAGAYFYVQQRGK